MKTKTSQGPSGRTVAARATTRAAATRRVGAAKKSATKKAATKGSRATSSKATSAKGRAPAKANKRSPAKKAPAKAAKAATKKAPAKAAKAATKKAPAKAAKKPAPSKPAPSKPAPAKKGPGAATKPSTKTPVRPAATSVDAGRRGKERARPTARPSGDGLRREAVAAPVERPYADDGKFLEEVRQALVAERATYQGQAADLKAEADSLAEEREPGDVQFDEESGEGGTVTVDRERDLALSAQALAAVEEIDEALARVAAGTYGSCERCRQPIPKPRLRALPFARLCVACKSGGLSSRR